MSARRFPLVFATGLAFRINMVKGFILEASPLPKLPVIALERVSSSTQEFFSVSLDHQSAEEERVNGTDKEIKYKPSFCRYPFVLLLDGIVSFSSSLSPAHTSLGLTPRNSSTPATLALSCVLHYSSASMPWRSPRDTPHQSLRSRLKHPRELVKPCRFSPSPTPSNSSMNLAAKVGEPTQQSHRMDPT
jgi:hypothetical protein